MADYPAHAPGVMAEEIDDDVCLYREDIHEVLALNRAAADVWRLADGQTALDDLVQHLARAYGATNEEFGVVVRGVVADLRQRGYLTLAHP